MIAKEFIQTYKLYHYTTFDSALKILLTKTLRFGKLANMNDIYEQYRQFGYSVIGTQDLDTIFHNEIAKYKQISLTQDSKNKEGRLGFDIPAMWGHYAEKGRGVCIVLDANILFNRLEKTCSHGTITYNRTHDDVAIDDNIATIEDVLQYIINNKKRIFFEKSEDWSYEQEYRIVSSVMDVLDISDCIMCVIIRDENWEDYNLRRGLLEKINSDVYLYSNFLGDITVHNGENQIYPDREL